MLASALTSARPLIRSRARHTAAEPAPRLTSRPLVWLLLAALWIASVGNLALWRALAALPELANGRGLAFGLAFGVAVTALVVMLLSLFNWRWTLKPAIALCLLTAAGGTYFMQTYGVVIDPTMMVNVLLTDGREARELFSWPMVGALLVLGVLPAAMLWRARLRWPGGWHQARTNAIVFVAACAVLALSGGLFFEDLSSTMRNHKQVRYLINPVNTFYSLARVGHRPVQRNGAAVLPLGEDARLAALAPGARPPLVLMVVGETARADHIGLNGYARDTTPELARAGVVSLRNVWSCGTNTAASVPCMFSNLGREAFGDRQANTEGLADVLQRAGLAVLWLDNQAGGCKGVCDRVPKVGYQALAAPGLCSDDGECLDEVMLRDLDARIAQLPPERRARGVVVFMHQMGSHGPAYYKRSPAKFKPFQPECATNALQQCEHAQLLNAYDNTIRYTDHFLASAIDWLKGQQSQWAPAMVYVSDHGESLGENNLYLHGLPYSIAPDVQKRVPWITWLSPAFQQQSGITSACLARQQDVKLSHDNYFHSTLGLLGVQTQVLDRAHDLYGRCRRAQAQAG
ncbi:phosphoethanolamine--lipid A transferase [Ottowia sp. GY511]|uniref:Phosphoethanolamine transferase n=1 Tax=Ottowia flava TaxID=2675430 RepID=A0ABW4KWY4_9BURK|nr:phosphoethanolamine--lipid A transferase [Ottowia sp. GY511]TXK24996.1 phosphoethanolamine--lipid A transferase [Ottowia sp. GY511]